MAKYPKIGRLTIAGTTYPAAINVSVLIELESLGIDIDSVLASGSNRMTKMVKLITLAINKGLHLSGREDESVTETQIADNIDISELTDVANQVGVLVSGNRTVEAELPKN